MEYPCLYELNCIGCVFQLDKTDTFSPVLSNSICLKARRTLLAFKSNTQYIKEETVWLQRGDCFALIRTLNKSIRALYRCLFLSRRASAAVGIHSLYLNRGRILWLVSTGVPGLPWTYHLCTWISIPSKASQGLNLSSHIWHEFYLHGVQLKFWFLWRMYYCEQELKDRISRS